MRAGVCRATVGDDGIPRTMVPLEHLRQAITDDPWLTPTDASYPWETPWDSHASRTERPCPRTGYPAHLWRVRPRLDHVSPTGYNAVEPHTPAWRCARPRGGRLCRRRPDALFAAGRLWVGTHDRAQARGARRNTRVTRTARDEVCKLRVSIGDRAYREPVYQVLGQHFGDVHPCSTGLIMRGFARPEILFEIDMAVALAKGTLHQRLHKF